MAVWKKAEDEKIPTAEWFASLLERSGFKPDELWTSGPTHLATASKFVFRLGHTHIEATGKEIASGVRLALLKRNAHTLTDLYDDGPTIVFKSPDAIQAFRDLLDQSDALTKAFRERMARAYARGEQQVRRVRPIPHFEDHQLVPAMSLA